ncbi:hypothetical protein [Sphingomonas sp.]|uniref:hypothetical protein n=1 Tax=Sphingomonas sp. TaxID=28214 RepID=UPI0025F2F9BC|nr:hypothetical protein [Sphingomonas sp.]
MTISWCLLACAVAMIAIIAGALVERGAVRSAGAAWASRAEAGSYDRERAVAVAQAMSLPPLDAVLAAVRAHVPPGIRLAEASRGEDGTISLSIDTTDPDALRAALSSDSLLGRLHERGQEARDDGTIRVRLTGEMG